MAGAQTIAIQVAGQMLLCAMLKKFDVTVAESPKSKGSTLPSKLIINEHEITNDKAIADQPYKVVSNIGKKLGINCTKTKSTI